MEDQETDLTYLKILQLLNISDTAVIEHEGHLFDIYVEEDDLKNICLGCIFSGSDIECNMLCLPYTRKCNKPVKFKVINKRNK